VSTLPRLHLALAFTLISASILCAQQSQPSTQSPTAAAKAPQSAIQKSVEAYLRNLYAFGLDVPVIVGPPQETNIPGLLETTIEVKIGDNPQTVKFYVSKDGKYLLRGELSDLSKDPLAENLAKLQIKDAPSMGDPDAPITIVEFSDFECPVCRTLHDGLRTLLPKYPQVRLVFKDFPLEQHPWARTAAIAGRCAYNQNPKAFWKLYDLIYDNQDIISAENAYSKLTDYATQIALNTEAFKSCLASPEAAATVEASHANGLTLEVSSTPTVFFNGRRTVGADPHLIEQNLNYELAKRKTANH
jgi:protein-disulfide isomerase